MQWSSSTLPAARWLHQPQGRGGLGKMQKSRKTITTSSSKLLGWRPSLLGWRPLLLVARSKQASQNIRQLQTIHLRVCSLPFFLHQITPALPCDHTPREACIWGRSRRKLSVLHSLPTTPIFRFSLLFSPLCRPTTLIKLAQLL